MGRFSVLNQEQAQLVRDIGMDPDQFVVLVDNERAMYLMHIKSRNEVTIHKKQGVYRGSQ